MKSLVTLVALVVGLFTVSTANADHCNFNGGGVAVAGVGSPFVVNSFSTFSAAPIGYNNVGFNAFAVPAPVFVNSAPNVVLVSPFNVGHHNNNGVLVVNGNNRNNNVVVLNNNRNRNNNVVIQSRGRGNDVIIRGNSNVNVRSSAFGGVRVRSR